MPLVGGRASDAQIYPPDLCDAMCRGIAKQKGWDAGRSVDSAKMSKGQLSSLMSKIVDTEVIKKLRIHSRAAPATRPIGGWRAHWIDHMHEPDGGEDGIGCERLGIPELEKHMSALYSRNGVPEAWDDMNDVFLNAAEVKKARATKMEFFN